MKFCPNCGNALQPGVKFCPACGMKIEAMQSVNAQPVATKSDVQSTKSNDLQATGSPVAPVAQPTDTGNGESAQQLQSEAGDGNRTRDTSNAQTVSAGQRMTTEQPTPDAQSAIDPQSEQQAQTNQQSAYQQQAQFNQPYNNQRTQQAIPAQPQLGFVGSVQYVLQHAFEFNGNVPESRKSVFWWGYLGMCIISIILAFIPVVGVLLDIAVQVLLISACMRRLAYIGQNTGVAWLLIIPVVGLYPYFLMLLDRKAA